MGQERNLQVDCVMNYPHLNQRLQVGNAADICSKKASRNRPCPTHALMTASRSVSSKPPSSPKAPDARRQGLQCLARHDAPRAPAAPAPLQVGCPGKEHAVLREMDTAGVYCGSVRG